MPNPIDMENASVARATVGDEMDSDQSLSSSVKDAEEGQWRRFLF